MFRILLLLNHLLDEFIDLLHPVSGVSTFVEVQELCGETSIGARKLEWVQELVGGFEIVSDSEDLVHEILHANNIDLAKVVLNDLIVRQSDPLLVNFAESTLVKQVTDGLEVRGPISNVRLHHSQHVDRGLVQFHEHTIVDLAQTKELQNLAHLWGNTNDTTDTNNKG